MRFPVRWSVVVLVALVMGCIFFLARQRLTVETNVVNALPPDDPVIADARAVISHHPLQERIVIDLSCEPHDMELLLAGADAVEGRLRKSGLFRQVGLGEGLSLFPEVIASIAQHLPVLFSARDLEESVLPLLREERVREALREQASQLQRLEGIGQAGLIARDPLGLRNLVMARLAPLAPGRGVTVVRGHLVSADGRHVLLTAEPDGEGMASAFSRRVADLFADTARGLDRAYAGRAVFTMTPMGAYRAALDNETLAKGDTRRAVLFSTIAIIVLLLVGFPRPLLGMLALPPALAGTAMALFVTSFVQKSVSVLAVGFGGAIISFTVDYGIAYLLFLDRPHETRGLEASREVWSLGVLAMLTTAVSFAFLFLSGFPALSQLGFFAALGVFFTFVFVHAVLPFVFPRVPPARREGAAALRRIVTAITAAGTPAKAWLALVFFVIMFVFAKPVFRADLKSMNSLKPETKAAEELIGKVWGDVFSRLYLMAEGRTLAEVRRKGDALADLVEAAQARGVIASGFLPAFVFPGEERARRNFAAWRAFWTPPRVAEMEKNLAAAARETGFAADAFAPFIALVHTQSGTEPEIPPNLHPLVGIAEDRGGDGWRLFATLTPGTAYGGEAFYRSVTAPGLGKLFDPTFFGERLGGIMMTGFITVALIVGIMTVIVAFLYLVDLPLTLIALAPTVFALVCTLGTLNLLGEPLGIPAIMVSAIVIGMGTDYALYLVAAWQRYLDDDHPSLLLIRMSVFLSFATTSLGFGVLALSAHAMLKSIGLALVLGIGYSFLGAAAIVPVLAERLFRPVPWPSGTVAPGSREHLRRVLKRYRHMEAYTRFFARFKILLDPMFPRLAALVKEPRMILDIGCGRGVPAVWLLALHPETRVAGLDPDARRVRFAARAVGPRGTVAVGRAPDLPKLPEPADTVLFLDVIHMLSDADLALTLVRLRDRMAPGARLVLRATVPVHARPSFERWLEKTRLRLHGAPVSFRSSAAVTHALAEAGFRIVSVEAAAPNRELYWFLAECP